MTLPALLKYIMTTNRDTLLQLTFKTVLYYEKAIIFNLCLALVPTR